MRMYIPSPIEPLSFLDVKELAQEARCDCFRFDKDIFDTKSGIMLNDNQDTAEKPA